MAGQELLDAAVKLPWEAWLATIVFLPPAARSSLASASRRSYQANREANWRFNAAIDEELFNAAYGTELPCELLEAWVGTP